LLRYCSSGWKFSWTICRILVRQFDYIVKAGQPPGPKTITGEGEFMTQYLVAIYHPDDCDPSVETEATISEIHALNPEMIAAGATKFAAGLSGASSARSLRAQPDGKVLVTDGPYIETKEHVGGFWILEAAELDEGLAWGRKAVIACRGARDFFPPPAWSN
jgi:hypothetical protein